MKGKIFISGGGDIPDTQELDKKYFELHQNRSKILYIPIAMEADMLGYESCYDWFSSLTAIRASDKEIDFTMLLENDDIPDLKKYDSVYIGGGNTFTLLNYILQKGLNNKIIDYLEDGGLVYGGSAGAIIFGKDIRTVEEENRKNYSEYYGLNQFNGLSIICHYTSDLDQQIFAAAKKVQTPVIAIPENAGLIMSDKNVEVVGQVFIFNELAKDVYKP